MSLRNVSNAQKAVAWDEKEDSHASVASMLLDRFFFVVTVLGARLPGENAGNQWCLKGRIVLDQSGNLSAFPDQSLRGISSLPTMPLRCIF
jgi:hypothetical protein